MFLRIEKAPLLAEVPAGFSLPAPTPLGVSGDSSLSPSKAPPEGIWADILHPFSPAAKPHYMTRLIELQAELSKTLEKEGDHLGREIKSDLKRLEAFNAEKIKMLHEHAEALQAQAKWSAWQALTEYVGYSGSIVLGAACFASGASAATALFFAASGFIGLINRIGSDSGAWRWAASYITTSHEKQVRIEQAARGALLFVSIALSFAGAWNAYHVCMYEKLMNEVLGRIGVGFELATSGMQGAIKAGEGYHFYHSSRIQVSLKLAAEKTLHVQTEIAMDTAEIQKQFALSKELNKVIKMALAAQQQWP